jgi:RNA polymerase sigma factor (sigma-70 family)
MRTGTFQAGVLAQSAARGHRVSNERYEAGAQHFINANPTMSTDSGVAFEELFLPHMDAAYNLARLLTGNAHDAEDVVQESYLKAFRAFPRFHGNAGRPWLLTIVRNTAFSWLRDNRGRADGAEYHEELHVSGGPTPEAESLGRERARALGHCVEQLSGDFREVIVLREMEELSYQEIAEIIGVPPGTVMSRLSRARARLADCLRNSRAGKQLAGRSGYDVR